jgi:HlyD family secretion protein
MGRINRKAVMTVSVITAVTFTVWAVFLSGSGNAISTSKTRDVKVWKAERQEITSAVSAPGIVQAAEKRDIYSPQLLTVKKLYVKRGDRVKAGDKLLEYDADQLESQYLQLLSGRNVQYEMLEKLKALDGSKNTSGLEAAADQAAAAVNSAWSEYDRLREDFNSLLSLYTERRASKKELDAAAEALKRADTAVESCEHAYEAAAANLNEAVRYNEQLEKSRSSDIKIQEENIKALELKIKDAEKALEDVRKSELSPLSGIVAGVNAAEGAPANIQYPVMSIVDTEKLEIHINIKEFDAASVKPGQKAAISGDSLNGSQLTGTVREVAPVAVSSSTLTGQETAVEAVVDIDGSPGRLMAGMNVTCRIVAEEKKDAIVVSYVTIKDAKDGSKSVFLVDGSGMIRERPVSLGITSDIDVEVVEGLEPGDLVVTNWQPSFKTGDRARIID